MYYWCPQTFWDTNNKMLQNCTKIPCKRLATIGEWPWRSLNITVMVDVRWVIYRFLLVVCNNNVSILHRFRDIATYTVYVTYRELEKSFSFDNEDSSKYKTRALPVHIVVNTCYISRGTRFRKVSNRKSDTQGHSRSRSLKVTGVGLQTDR